MTHTPTNRILAKWCILHVPYKKMTTMRKLFTLLMLTAAMELSYAQNVGIGTTTPQAKLDISSSTDGVLLPRVALTSTSNFAPLALSPTTSTLVYNTATAGSGTTAVTPGFYYWDGTQWVRISDAGASSKDWTIANTSASPAVTTSNQYVTGNVGIGNFSATTPSVALDVRTTDAVKLPNGTTAQRPASPLAGATRFNSDIKALEYYDGTQWVSSNMEQTPVGTIVPYGGSTIPSGWLVCDGSAVSRTTYSALFAAIGISWGYGDNSTTFNLPDLRGRFLRGVDGGANVDPDKASRTASNAGGNTGNNVGSLQGDAMGAHTHSVSGTTAGAGTLTTSGESGHTHSIDPPNTTTTTNGDHTHWVSGGPRDDGNGSGSGSNGQMYGLWADAGSYSASDPNYSYGRNTLNSGSHTHTMDIAAFTSGASSGHTHTIADHSHTISLTSGAASSTTASENRPKNAGVTYIIKVSSTSTTAVVSASIPTGILGQTLYNNGTNFIATSNLYHNGTLVGVGTTNPYQKLEIGNNGGLGFSGTGPSLNASDKKLYSPADGDLEWMTNNAAGVHGFAISNQGTKAVYLNSSGSSYLNGGSVGIGTSGPLSKLDVSGGVAVGSYAGANAAPTNGLIVSGSVGVGTASPAYTLDVTGTSRVTGNMVNGGFDFILGNTDQSSRGNSGSSRALVKDGGNVLDINYGSDFSGGTRVYNLAGTGNRDVYVDATGLLLTSPNRKVAYLLDRSERTMDATNAGFRVNGVYTSNLAVEAGDVIVVNATFQFRWTGGSGTDQPRFGIITSGCATITQLDSYEYQNADNIARNEYMPISKQFIITSTCSGNLAFGLYIDNNTNADDNSATSDVVISATKY